MLVSGNNVDPTTIITAFGTGSGGSGTYTINLSQAIVNSTTMTGLLTKFQEITFEEPLTGPSPDWVIDPNKKHFSSMKSGWYLMTYKLDLRTNSDSNFDYTRAAASLMVLKAGNWVQVSGSGSAAQAPDTIHQYSISNTILVEYTAGEEMAMQWWAGYYTGTVPILQTTTAGLSVGPNNTTNPEKPWIPAVFQPDGSLYDPYKESMASLVITRIVDTS